MRVIFPLFSYVKLWYIPVSALAIRAVHGLKLGFIMHNIKMSFKTKQTLRAASSLALNESLRVIEGTALVATCRQIRGERKCLFFFASVLSLSPETATLSLPGSSTVGGSPRRSLALSVGGSPRIAQERIREKRE
ncbi:hypothetical protein YC2023_055094 [Brassica napus]